MKKINKDAYTPGPCHKLVIVTVELMLDAVPGAWHTPEDFLNWVCTHTYVQSAECIDVP